MLYYMLQSDTKKIMQPVEKAIFHEKRKVAFCI